MAEVVYIWYASHQKHEASRELSVRNHLLTVSCEKGVHLLMWGLLRHAPTTYKQMESYESTFTDFAFIKFVPLSDVLQIENLDIYLSTYCVRKENVEANLCFQCVHLFLVLLDLGCLSLYLLLIL